jgi:hypothetical protein
MHAAVREGRWSFRQVRNIWHLRTVGVTLC